MGEPEPAPGAPVERAPEVQEREYTLPGLEGAWTMQQLVDMELQHDPRLAQVRRKALPPEFWDARRKALNHNRLQRNYSKRKRRGDELRRDELERLAGMDAEQQAEYQRQKEAGREAAKEAAAAQRAHVAEAMEQGLRIVVDCSFSAGPSPAAEAGGASSSAAASDREVRSLCKQLELCAAANKRAARPVSLQFVSFAGPVKRFALEAMHANRWPAARCHEAPLQQVFSSQDLVVLSPDAEQPLLALDPGKVYVIGGLVDRTIQKGASLKLAQQCGAAAARLPIAEHLGKLAKGKSVLNVNDVFLALLAVHAGEGWAGALERAIPQRFRQQPPAADSTREAQHTAADVDAPALQQAADERGEQQAAAGALNSNRAEARGQARVDLGSMQPKAAAVVDGQFLG